MKICTETTAAIQTVETSKQYQNIFMKKIRWMQITVIKTGRRFYWKNVGPFPIPKTIS